jgi:hypothetical protein
MYKNQKTPRKNRQKQTTEKRKQSREERRREERETENKGTGILCVYGRGDGKTYSE